jgi:hypothetical protein
MMHVHATLLAPPGTRLGRHLGTFLSRFGEPNRDGLFSARDLLAAAAALQRPALSAAHCALYGALGFLAIFCHDLPTLRNV